MDEMTAPDPVGSLTPLEGGWSGETFLSETLGERSVVRIYAGPSHRGALAHEVDAALLRLVRGLLPVAEVLECRGVDPEAGTPALLVTSFLPGVRGDLLLPQLDGVGLGEVGEALGGLLADLGGMPMLTAGPFVDAHLRIGSFGEVDGLPGAVELAEPSLGWWSPDELAGLRAVALDAQAALDTCQRHCLVHSDLNPKNLLLDPGSRRVTGLVDWEYAHAGHPYTDLGNLLRFERDEVLTESVLTAYVGQRGGSVDEALELARAADLWALLDLATRRGSSPVAERADAHLRAIARTADLHAQP